MGFAPTNCLPCQSLRCLVLSADGASSGESPASHDHFNHVYYHLTPVTIGGRLLVDMVSSKRFGPELPKWLYAYLCKVKKLRLVHRSMTKQK